MAVVTQTCVGCSEQFTFVVKRGHRRRFCTKECSNKKYQQSTEGKAYQKIYRVTDEYKLYQKEYQQSDKCKLKVKKYRQTDKGKSARLKKSQSRRAWKRDAFVEDVDVRVLLDLQGGACSLCSQPILSYIKYPDPMSLSLDHITPLIRGGLHSYANCAATHLRCNLVKGVKSVDDVAPLLRLVS
jgi:hypothetical protein